MCAATRRGRRNRAGSAWRSSVQPVGEDGRVGYRRIGNKSDLDEDDLLTFFEQRKTAVVAMHVEDLKGGRSFADVARRVTRKKPVVVLKAGRTPAGAKAASSHTAALAGNDKVYDDVLGQCGVIRAFGLRDMLEYARGVPVLPRQRVRTSSSSPEPAVPACCCRTVLRAKHRSGRAAG